MGLPHLPTARAVVYALMYNVYYYCSFFEKISVQIKHLQVQTAQVHFIYTLFIQGVSKITYIMSPVELCGSIVLFCRTMSNR
jgi:hypothetical protein